MPSTVELPRTRGPGTGRDDNWRVIVRNDSHNTFDHVARTLARFIPGVTLDSGYSFADRIHNRGQALVWGGPREESGVVEGLIGRDPRNRKRMAVLRAGPERDTDARPRIGPGKVARTRWRVVRRFGPVSELELELDTGRTHQIRVHLAHLKLPVVGDPVYGGRPKKLLSTSDAERSLAGALLDQLPRQALHAAALEFAHPVSGLSLRFVSPVPADIARALDALQAFREGPRG